MSKSVISRIRFSDLDLDFECYSSDTFGGRKTMMYYLTKECKMDLSHLNLLLHFTDSEIRWSGKREQEYHLTIVLFGKPYGNPLRDASLESLEKQLNGHLIQISEMLLDASSRVSRHLIGG